MRSCFCFFEGCVRNFRVTIGGRVDLDLWRRMRQMSERDRQRHRSPLESGRGITTVKDAVVSKIAGIAAGEVEGIRMGGSASRAAGGVLENVTGSQGMSRGVSVEVGKLETAIDL